MGTMGTVKPYLYTQRYYHTSNYAYLTGMRLNEDGENIDFGQTMVHTIKFTERYGAGIEANLHPDPNHITVLGVGTDINFVAQFEDQEYVNGSSVAEPSSLVRHPAHLFAYSHLRSTPGRPHGGLN